MKDGSTLHRENTRLVDAFAPQAAGTAVLRLGGDAKEGKRLCRRTLAPTGDSDLEGGTSE
jgi:hypothetical protein